PHQAAARLYRQAAAQNHPQAQHNLGALYEHNHGIDATDPDFDTEAKRHAEAAKLYELAARGGVAAADPTAAYPKSTNPNGQYILARTYPYGHGNAEAGNADGQHALARFYADGLGGITADEATAVALLELAANDADTNPNAQYDLAIRYQDNDGVTGTKAANATSRAAEALRLLTLASNGPETNPTAQFTLAARHLDHHGAAPSIEITPESGNIETDDTTQAITIPRRESDNTPRQIGTARALELLLTGQPQRPGPEYTLAPDVAEALAEAQAARTTLLLTEGLVNIAANKEDGTPKTAAEIVAEREFEAVRLLEHAARGPNSETSDPYIPAGHTQAQYDLAVRYVNGTGVTRDDATAAELFALAAHPDPAPAPDYHPKNHPAAQYALGFLHQIDRGVSSLATGISGLPTATSRATRLENAVNLYRQAVAQDHPDAQYALGVLYESPRSVPGISGTSGGRRTIAFCLYELAARGGTSGTMEYPGCTVANRAAGDYPENGHADAQYALSRFLARGRAGFTRDPDAAVQLLRAASTATDDNPITNPEAQLTLALRYQEGRDVTIPDSVTTDPAEKTAHRLARAAELYRLAADQTTASAHYRLAAPRSSARALYRLGKMYENGDITLSTQTNTVNTGDTSPTGLVTATADTPVTHDEPDYLQAAFLYDLAIRARPGGNPGTLTRTRDQIARAVVNYPPAASYPADGDADALFALGELHERGVIPVIDTPILAEAEAAAEAAAEEAAEAVTPIKASDIPAGPRIDRDGKTRQEINAERAARQQSREQTAREQTEQARRDAAAAAARKVMADAIERIRAPRAEQYQHAAALYKLAANQAHAEAQYALGHLHERELIPTTTQVIERLKTGGMAKTPAEIATEIAALPTTIDLAINPLKAGGTAKTDSEIATEVANAHLTRAAELYELSARGGTPAVMASAAYTADGHAPAQYRLGRLIYLQQRNHGPTLNDDGIPVSPPAPPADYTQVVRLYQAAVAQDYAPAQNALGLLTENGEGITGTAAERRTAALRLYRRANLQGHADGSYNLGRLHATGVCETTLNEDTVVRNTTCTTKPNYAEAFLRYRQAAAQKHPAAQTALGLLYANGQGTTKDPSRAYLYLSLGIANSEIRGIDCAGAVPARPLPSDADPAQIARRAAQEAAQAARVCAATTDLTTSDPHGPAVARNPAAEAIRDSMATLISDGQKFALDTQLSAMLGNPAAQYQLGTLHQTGTGVPQNIDHAYLWFQIAALNYDDNPHTLPPPQPAALTAAIAATAPAASNRAALTSRAMGCRENNYIRAPLGVHGPCGEAEELGTLHARAVAQETGDSVPVSVENAIPLYQRAAARGHAPAQYALGRLTESGQSGTFAGTESRLARAATFYRQAAIQAHPGAQYALGRFFENDLGGVTIPPYAGDPDPATDTEAERLARAACLYELSARGGIHLRTCTPLADSADYPKRDGGNADAQHALARFYEAGLGGLDMDDPRAVELLKLASNGEDTNPDAQFNLATRHEDGRGVRRHVKSAVRFLELSSRGPDSDTTDPYSLTGNADAQYNLATRYEDGRGVTANDATAVTLLELAANGDDTNADAQFNLATRYEEDRGITITPNKLDGTPKTAEEITAERDAEAVRLLELSARGNDSETADPYSLAGNADAQYNLAMRYETGNGVPMDEATAVELLELASNGDDTNADAQYALAIRYENNDAVTGTKAATPTTREEEAVRLLELASRGDDSSIDDDYPDPTDTTNTGNADAQYNLALRHLNQCGRTVTGITTCGVTTNESEAVRLLELASNGDDTNADAQYALAIRYENDDEVSGAKSVSATTRETEAVRLLECAARGDDSDPNADGNCIEHAAHPLSMAATGNAAAQYNLANRYLNQCGRAALTTCGVTTDEPTAVALLELAANGDDTNADAQYALALRYETGDGVTMDDAEAVRLLELAARGDDSTLADPYIAAGHTDAQYNLAVRYINARGVPQRDVRAAELFKLAADKGRADAQYALGFLYQIHRGTSVTIDTDGKTDAQVATERRAAHLAEAAELYDQSARGGTAATNPFTDPYPDTGGNSNAQYALARLYHQNLVVLTPAATDQQRLERAVRLYELAACGGNVCATDGEYPDTGHADAQYHLSRIYEQGLETSDTTPVSIVSADAARAVRLLEAASLGANTNPDAQLALAQRYENADPTTIAAIDISPTNADGTTKTDDEVAAERRQTRLARAAGLYRRAASRAESAIAYYRLGRLYELGQIFSARTNTLGPQDDGVTPITATTDDPNAVTNFNPDYLQAGFFYGRAADLNYAPAQYALGSLYDRALLSVDPGTFTYPAAPAIDSDDITVTTSTITDHTADNFLRAPAYNLPARSVTIAPNKPDGTAKTMPEITAETAAVKLEAVTRILANHELARQAALERQRSQIAAFHYARAALRCTPGAVPADEPCATVYGMAEAQYALGLPPRTRLNHHRDPQRSHPRHRRQPHPRLHHRRHPSHRRKPRRIPLPPSRTTRPRRRPIPPRQPNLRPPAQPRPRPRQQRHPRLPPSPPRRLHRSNPPLRSRRRPKLRPRPKRPSRPL
ncbi:MAG: sel1 repeat family protein, partial [Cellvibrionales bacterium]|nr:sel1 repeat family protein [Cellvibrionales bacterium]